MRDTIPCAARVATTGTSRSSRASFSAKRAAVASSFALNPSTLGTIPNSIRSAMASVPATLDKLLRPSTRVSSSLEEKFTSKPPTANTQVDPLAPNQRERDTPLHEHDIRPREGDVRHNVPLPSPHRP